MVPYYYPRVIERVSTAIVDVLNDVKINRFNEEGEIDKIIDVPIIHHYSKNFAQFIRNTNRVKESMHQTPILGLRITGMQRDTSRITQQNYIRKIFDTERDLYLRDRRPSPWKISYSLSIYTEHLIDFSQIIENIVTYFDPTLTVSIKEFENVNIERDLIVTLSDVSFDLADEVDRAELQSYSADLSLTVSVVLYPPVSGAAIIKHITQNIIEKNRGLGKILNDGTVPGNIDEYVKGEGEIVTEGSLIPSYVVNSVASLSELYARYEITQASPLENTLIELPGGFSVVYVEILVTERFNSYNTTMSIGTDADPEKYMKTSENTPYFTAKYAISFDRKVNSDETIKLFFNRSSATEGTAYVSIAWK